MKKALFTLYTILRVLWVPLVITLPWFLIKQTGVNSYTTTIPFIPVLALVAAEIILQQKYRKDFSLLDTKYWVTTAVASFMLSFVPLVLALPDLPLHSLAQNHGPYAGNGFVLILSALSAGILAVTTAAAIVIRQRTVALHKKSDLFS